MILQYDVWKINKNATIKNILKITQIYELHKFLQISKYHDMSSKKDNNHTNNEKLMKNDIFVKGS